MFLEHVRGVKRHTSNIVHLLIFQFHAYGGSFNVEVASCSVESYVGPGRDIPPSEVSAHVVPVERLRLGDHWFKFDERYEFPINNTTTFFSRDGDTHERAAKAVLRFLDTKAEESWKGQGGGDH